MSKFTRGEENLQCKIIIRNYNLDLTEKDMTDMFEKFGKIEDLFSPKDRDTRRPRGFTFCQYRKKEEAEAAVKAMDGQDIDGMKLSVEFCRIPRPENRDRDRGRDRGRDRDRDRRRSRSPHRRRRSRSRSRDRGYGRDRNRSRERDIWRMRDEFPPHMGPPFDPYPMPPPPDFHRPPRGGPGPRSRSGLLDPPFSLSSEGPGGPPPSRGMPPPRGGGGGYNDDLPPPGMRDSYGSGPPPPRRGPPPSSSPYGPPPPSSGSRDYYDDPYFDRQGGSSGGSSYRPPEPTSYSSRPPHDMPPSGGSARDYPPRKSDPYDSYSSAPQSSQLRDGFNGANSYRSGGLSEPSGPTNRFSSSTGPGSNYNSSLSKSDFSSSDSYYSSSNRGPSNYGSDPPSRPPPSNPSADRYGGPSSADGRSSFSSGSGGMGNSYGGSGAVQRGYDSSSFGVPRGPASGSTGYGASSASVGRGAPRSGGYSSGPQQGRADDFSSSTQAVPKVGYSGFNNPMSSQRNQPSVGRGAGQGYGTQDYKPGARY